MTKILCNLLIDFFDSAFPFTNLIFGKLVDIVFYVEKHLADGSIFANSEEYSPTGVNLLFDNTFNELKWFGITLIIFKFLKKILDIYIMGTDVDPSISIENLIIGFMKSLVLIFSFDFLYGVFATISTELIEGVRIALDLASFPDIGAMGLTSIFSGLFMLIGLLVFFICYLLLVFQILKRGIEMFVLRLGFPLACVGLLDSDKGVFAPYLKIFIQNTISVLIQLSLLQLGFYVLQNGNLWFGIAMMTMALKTPQFVQQFMVGVGGSGVNMMSINQTVSMGSRIVRCLKK